MSRRSRGARRRAGVVIAATMLFIAAAACSTTVDPPATAEDAGSTATSEMAAPTTEVPATTTTSAPVATTATTAAETGVPIAVRFERRTTDAATEGFEDAASATLTDERGWTRAGFSFEFRDDAPYRIVLGEPAATDAACLPYDVQGQYSCQIGPTVALNADRWRSATPTWTGSVEEYRAMLVNHEVGHLLGMHHPAVRCSAAGAPAPVMAQQSKGLEGCTANPWPLDWEISCAQRHDEPLAPGYEPSASPLCGPDDV